MIRQKSKMNDDVLLQMEMNLITIHLKSLTMDLLARNHYYSTNNTNNKHLIQSFT